MMFLRIYVLYRNNRLVILFVGSIYAAELSVNAWLLTYGSGMCTHLNSADNYMKFSIAVRHVHGINGMSAGTP